MHPSGGGEEAVDVDTETVLCEGAAYTPSEVCWPKSRWKWICRPRRDLVEKGRVGGCGAD